MFAKTVATDIQTINPSFLNILSIITIILKQHNILAINNGISDLALNKLRNDCIKEVKQINGSLSYEEAIKWQT